MNFPAEVNEWKQQGEGNSFTNYTTSIWTAVITQGITGITFRKVFNYTGH